MIQSRPILRLLAPRTFWLLAGIIVLIEAIYVAEEFTTLMQFIVSHGGTVVDTLILASLQTPEVIDFALPIAILISLYFAILNAREANELVACASAGVSWIHIPRFALAVGLLGLCLSLVFSSLLAPMAQKAKRVYGQGIEARAIAREVTTPGQKDAIREFQGRAFIATPRPGDEAERGHIFIYQPDDGEGWRASQADDWTVVGPREDGSYAVELRSYRDYIGRTQEQQAAVDNQRQGVNEILQGADWNVKNVALTFRLEELMRPISDTALPQEQVLFLATFQALWNASGKGEIDSRVGAVLARGLGCLLAALLAVAIAAWSNTRIGRYGALPVGVVVLMGADVLTRSTLVQAAEGSSAALTVAFVVALVLTVALPFAYIVWRSEALLIPRRSQS